MTSTATRSVVGAAGALALGAVALLHAQTAAQQPAARTAVTFNRDVAPILQQKCQVCHHPDSIAPMSLLTYADAKKFSSAIKARVESRIMPPWHIDRTIGIRDFKNDRGLTDAQIDTIVSWVNGGAVEGDPKDL